MVRAVRGEDGRASARRQVVGRVGAMVEGAWPRRRGLIVGGISVACAGGGGKRS
jgi:hypothetical protein